MTNSILEQTFQDMEKIFGTEATPKSPMCLNSECDYFDKSENNHCTAYVDITICADFKGGQND